MDDWARAMTESKAITRSVKRMLALKRVIFDGQSDTEK
jgi:hypothetical protein